MRFPAPAHLIISAALFLLSLAVPGAADTLPRESQMAISHVEAVIPTALARCDLALLAVMDEADRAHRGVIVPTQAQPTMIDARGEYTYRGANAMTDTIMACEYAAALWSRRLDLIERGLGFEALPQPVSEWRPGVVGLMAITGTFDDTSDRFVRVLRVLGPSRMLATATVVGVNELPSDPFIIDGLSTANLLPNDYLAIGDDPFAVVSEDVQTSNAGTRRTPILRPVLLDRYGSLITVSGRREVERYRLSHLRPSRKLIATSDAPCLAASNSSTPPSTSTPATRDVSRRPTTTQLAPSRIG